MAHLLAGGEAAPAMKATTGLRHGRGVFGRLLLHRAADFADHDDGIGARVAVERRSASRVVVPSIGSPPMPMNADWPRPARDEVEADQSAEAAAARDHADAARLEDARR